MSAGQRQPAGTLVGARFGVGSAVSAVAGGSGGGGILDLRAHHASRYAQTTTAAQAANAPAPKPAVMQQMDNALLHAALAESQAARYAAALHGKMQKALTVGVALGRGRPARRPRRKGRLHVALKGAKRQPDQRVEPVQAGHGVRTAAWSAGRGGGCGSARAARPAGRFPANRRARWARAGAEYLKVNGAVTQAPL